MKEDVVMVVEGGIEGDEEKRRKGERRRGEDKSRVW